MTNITTYNGWTNYATWRINLEIFDGIEHNEVFDLTLDSWDLRHVVQDYAEEVIFSGRSYDERGQTNLMEDYARAFLSDVNWHEIASHMIEDYKLETEEE